MRYSLTNVFGDPFWLTTIPMAIVGWVVALVGSVLNSTFDSSTFPVFSWWGIAFEMVAILLTLHVAFSNQIRMYRLAVLSFLSIATIYTTNNTNNFVWRENSSSGTAAAGNILLSIINLVWILYLGTTQDEPAHTYIDSFAAYKKTSPAQSEFHRRMRERRRRMMANNYAAPAAAAGGGGSAPWTAQQQAAAAQRARGTEDNPYRLSDAPHNIQIGAPTGFSKQTDATNPNVASDPLHSTYLYSVEQLNRHGLSGHEVDSAAASQTGSMMQRYTANYAADFAEDPYFGDNHDEQVDSMVTIAKARARYSYQARVSEGELSFSEGDILDVCDKSGNWWWCKRQDGEYGICPKNYLELLDDSLL